MSLEHLLLSWSPRYVEGTFRVAAVNSEEVASPLGERPDERRYLVYGGTSLMKNTALQGHLAHEKHGLTGVPRS